MFLSARACFLVAAGCFSVAALLALYMAITGLSTGNLVGCGELTGCHTLLSSQWAKIYPGIPVALPAAAIYAWLACLSWAGRVQSIAWFPAGLVIGAAIWFIALQVHEHAFCPYCSAAHGSALIGTMCLFRARRSLATATSSSRRPRILLGLAGIAVVGLLALFQTALPFKGNRSHESHHALSLPATELLSEFPGSGSAASSDGHAIFLFDYCCLHCRTVQSILVGLEDQLSAAGMRVTFLPSPLNAQCNPFLLASPGSAFDHACDYAVTMLGLWRRDPQLYAQLLDFVLSPDQLISLDELVTLADGLPAGDDLRWAQNALVDGTRLYGNTVESTGIRALPILLHARKPGHVRIMQGEMDADTVLNFLLSGNSQGPTPAR